MIKYISKNILIKKQKKLLWNRFNIKGIFNPSDVDWQDYDYVNHNRSLLYSTSFDSVKAYKASENGIKV